MATLDGLPAWVQSEQDQYNFALAYGAGAPAFVLKNQVMCQGYITGLNKSSTTNANVLPQVCPHEYLY